MAESLLERLNRKYGTSPEEEEDDLYRADGTRKGKGFLGELPMQDGSGKVATEISIGREFDGKEMQIPTLVPTLNDEQREYLLKGGDPREREDIVRLADEHAMQRLRNGISPFATDEEISNKGSLLERLKKSSERKQPVIGAEEPEKEASLLERLGRTTQREIPAIGAEEPAAGQSLLARLGKVAVKEKPAKPTFNQKVEYMMTPMGGYTRTYKEDPSSFVGQSRRQIQAGLKGVPLLTSGAGVMQQLADAGEIAHEWATGFVKSYELKRLNELKKYGEPVPEAMVKKIEEDWDFDNEFVNTLRDKADTWRTAAQGIADDLGVDPAFANSFIGQVMKGVGEAPFYVLSAMAGPVGLPALYGAGYEEATADYLNLIKEEGREYDPYEAFKYAVPYAMGATVLERLGLEVAIAKLIPKGTKVSFREILKKFATAGPAEGLTEAAQGFLQDALASITVDDERTLFSQEDLMDRLKEFGVGFFVGSGTTAVLQGGYSAADKTQRKIEEKQFYDYLKKEHNLTDEQIEELKSGTTAPVSQTDMDLAQAFDDEVGTDEPTGSIGPMPINPEIKTEAGIIDEFDDAETGRTIGTGRPIAFNAVHNPQRAPDTGPRFGQDIEPAGRYIVPTGRGVTASSYETSEGTPIPLNPDGTITVFHRTDIDPQQIKESGTFVSEENTNEIYVSTRSDGQTTGYGKNVIELRVPQDALVMEDQFGDEVHFRVPISVANESLQSPRFDLNEYDFESPLVIRWGGYGPDGWKARLSKMFGGKTGKELSQAIRNAGYDAIITVDEARGEQYASEVVDLRGFKNRFVGSDKISFENLGIEIPVGDRVVNKGKKKGPPVKFAGWMTDKDGNVQFDNLGNPIPQYDITQPFPEMGFKDASELDPATLSAQDLEKSGYEFTLPEPPDTEIVKRAEENRRRAEVRDALTGEGGAVLPEVQALLDQRTLTTEAINERRDQAVINTPVSEVEAASPPLTEYQIRILEAKEEMDLMTEEGRRNAWIAPADRVSMDTLMEQTEAEAAALIEADETLAEVEEDMEFDSEEERQEFRDTYQSMLRDILARKFGLAKMKVARYKPKLKIAGKRPSQMEMLQKKLDDAERKLIRAANSKKEALAKLREQRDQKLAEMKEKFQNKLAIAKARAAEQVALQIRKRINAIAIKVQQRQDITLAIRELENLEKMLPVGIRGKFTGYGTLADLKTRPAQQRFLQKKMKRVNEMLDEYTLRQNYEALKKVVKNVTKRKKLPVELAVFQKIKKYGEMDRDAAMLVAENLLNPKDENGKPDTTKEALTPEQLEDVFLAQMFGGKLNPNETIGFWGHEMKAARDEIDFILREGKTKIAERIQQRQERNNALRIATIEEIIPEGIEGLKSDRRIKWDLDQKGRFRKIVRGIDNYMNVGHDGLEMLLDNLRWRGDRFTGFFQDHIFSPIFQAQSRVEVRNRMALKRLNTMVQRVLVSKGIEPTKKNIVNELANWNENIEKTGIRYKHQSNKIEEQPMTKWEAVSMWMQYQDETLHPTFEEMGVDEKTMAAVEKFIGEDGKAMGRFMLAEYKRMGFELRKVVADNDNYVIQIIDNYSPITRYHGGKVQEDIMDMLNMQDFRKGNEKNRSLIERRDNLNELIFKPAQEVFMQHVYQMHHYFEFADIANDIRAIFSNAEVRRAIKQKTGGTEYMSTLDTILSNIMRGGIERAKFEKTVNAIVKGSTIGGLALRIPVFFKQMGSFPGYMAAMPADEWAKYTTEFFKPGFQDRVRTLVETDYIQNRISGGYERDIKAALKKTFEQNVAGFNPLSIMEGSKLDRLMILTRLGDVGAIVMGGWALYQYTYDQTYAKLKAKNMDDAKADELAKVEAEKKFAEVTARQQQDSNLFSLGYYQQMGSFAKLFTQYMTTPIQYHRNVFNAIKAYGAGRIGRKELAKQLFVFHVLLPQIYTAIGSAFLGILDDSDDFLNEFWDRQLRALWVGNFNSVWIGGEAMQSLVQAWGKEDMGYLLQTSLPALDNFTKVTQGLWRISVADGDPEKLWKGADRALNGIFSAIGIPYGAIMNELDAVYDAIYGEENNWHKAARLAGWTDYQIPGEEE